MFLHGYIESRLAESTFRFQIFYHRLMHPDTDAAVARLYQSDWGRIVATLIRLTGDFEVNAVLNAE